MCSFEAGEFGEPNHRAHGFPFFLGPGALEGLPSRVNRTVDALNRLAGYKFNQPFLQHAHRPPTAVQQKLLDRVTSAIDQAGECPEGITMGTALQDLMRSHNLYDGEPGNLAQYDPGKLKILRSAIKPRSLSELLPPHVLPLLRRKHAHIERSPEEFQEFNRDNPSCCPRQPYWDSALRNDSGVRLDFFRRLFSVGVLSFRTKIRSKVGIFFVKKKTPDAIRMIIDARITNAHHRPPPVTRLGSAANYADLDLSEEGLNGRFDAEHEHVGWGSEMDVSDCFYQFDLKEMASWFGIDYPLTVRTWRKHGIDIKQIYDESLGTHVTVSDDQTLFPVISVMPMGWSWALFLANETVAHVVRTSSPKETLELREKLPVPQVWDAGTLASTYVDNVAIVGARRQDVADRVSEIDAAFRDKGIPVVWTYPEPVRVLETVGCVVDFEKKILRHKAHRIWRTHLAGLTLCQRGKIRPHVVEVWLGHATSLMRLSPGLLSVFDKIYRFVRIGGDRRVHLWPSVRAEISSAAHLLWLCFVDLGAGFIKQVDIGDSANTGYALLTRNTPTELIQGAWRFREKWRFMPMPESLKELVGRDPESLANDVIYEFGNLENGVRTTHPERSRDGAGLSTSYAKWLQEALHEGSWLKTSALLSQFRAKRPSRIDVECPALVEPLDPRLLDESQFKLLWSKAWKNPDEHINIKEARVALSSLKRSARVASLTGMKKLTLSDNLATVLCFEKGRSGRPSMNRLCRVAGAIQAGLGIRWRLRHIETSRNLADEPSRRFEKRHTHRPSQREPLQGLVKAHPHQHVPGPSPPKPPCQLPEHSGSGHHPQIPRQICLYDELFPSSVIAQETLTDLHRACGQLSAVASIQRGSAQHEGRRQSCADMSKKGAPGLFRRGRFLEVFSGSGNLTKTIQRNGLQVLTPIDIRHGSHHDLTRRSTQVAVKKIIEQEDVTFLHCGTVCTAFSRARHGIRNLVRARERERVACELAFFSCELARLCHSRGGYWAIENPASSRLWEFPAILELMALSGVRKVNFPMRHYGAEFKKPTTILTNCPLLECLVGECTHKKHRQVLRGRVRAREGHGFRWMNRTAVAGAYPDKLCRRWADAIRHLLLDAAEEPRADPGILETSLRIAATQPKPRSFCCVEKAEKDNPCLLESIVFGQHTRAEAQARRLLRRKQKYRNRHQETQA